MPAKECGEGVQKHDDVEREIVPYPVADEYFHEYRERDGRPYRKARREPKSQYHERDIRSRIDDAIPEVIERDGNLAIPINDERTVLEHFPGRFGDGGENEPQTPRERNAPAAEPRRDEREDPVEREAVDNV